MEKSKQVNLWYHFKGKQRKNNIGRISRLIGIWPCLFFDSWQRCHWLELPRCQESLRSMQSVPSFRLWVNSGEEWLKVKYFFSVIESTYMYNTNRKEKIKKKVTFHPVSWFLFSSISEKIHWIKINLNEILIVFHVST